jgi:hypothetical protein
MVLKISLFPGLFPSPHFQKRPWERVCVSSTQAKYCKQAMQAEPKDRKVLPGKWVYKVK